MTTENDDIAGAELIDFASIPKPSSDERLFKRKPKPRAKYCRFHRFEYDPHDQTVWCAACEKVFSGFEAFLEIAHSWEFVRSNRDLLQSEVSGLLQDRDRLKKDVANLKAAKRRADETVTAIVKALTDHERTLRFRDAKSDFAAGARAALHNAIEFLKSDSWRATANQGDRS